MRSAAALTDRVTIYGDRMRGGFLVGQGRRLPRKATWGLLVAWALHDAEELATMPGWAQGARPRLERRFPWIPAGVWERFSVSGEHTATAIGLMGCLIGTAATRGARTGGRSSFFQTVLMGFGIHAVSHLASAALVRGYTPGVITAPTVVAPFSWWAWRRVREANVSTAPTSPGNLVLLPVSIVVAHTCAAVLVRARRRLQRNDEPHQ